MMHPSAIVAPPAAVLVTALSAALPATAEVSADCRAMFEGERLSVVVPNGPGGGYDTYARAMAPVIAETTGARVSVENLPGAGGLIALRRIVDAQPDDWVILVVEAYDVQFSVAEGELGPDDAQKIRLMSIFHSEPSALVVRPGFDALDPPGGKLVGGSSATNEDIGFSLLAKAAGLTSETIIGYAGTSAMSLGLLGGEIDTISISLATAQRATKAGDLDVAFVLSEGPHPAAPDLPYLLGPGGRLEPLLAAMTEPERAEALRLAETVVDLGKVLRTVAVPMALPPDRMACLENVMDVVLLGDAFRSAAEAEGRAVDALTSDASQAALAELSDAIDAGRAFMQTLP
jgi:tripartite-type tricarboxylate transporter receptor subunit TctC